VGAVYGVGVGLGFGTPHRSATAAGLMLVPMAGLAIGLVQTTSLLMPELGGRVAAIVLAAVAIFETIGPPLVAFALRLCGEARPPDEPDDADAPLSTPPRPAPPS
jgi:hypothetical protein